MECEKDEKGEVIDSSPTALQIAARRVTEGGDHDQRVYSVLVGGTF